MKYEDQPLVTVIVPVYKVEAYIGKCIESIQNQTYSHLQIILVNDASPDDSGAICDTYSESDPRITVIHHEVNMGLSCTRNDALDIAKGEFIVFVDSDDYINPTLVENCLRTAIDKEVDVVIFDISIVEHGTITPQSMDTAFFKDREAAYKAIIEDKISCVVWDKFYKKHLWSSLRFQENTNCEDFLIMPDLFKQVESIYYLQKPLYYYNCENENSITSNLSAKNKYGVFCSFLYRQPLAAELGMPELVQYYRYRAIRNGVGCIGLNLVKPEISQEQVDYVMNYLRDEENAPDRPPIGGRNVVLLYAALHNQVLSKFYGHTKFALEQLKKKFK